VAEEEGGEEAAGNIISADTVPDTA